MSVTEKSKSFSFAKFEKESRRDGGFGLPRTDGLSVAELFTDNSDGSSLANVGSIHDRMQSGADLTTRLWCLVPIPIDGISLLELYRVVGGSRIDLANYTDWDAANRAASELAMVGGVKEVVVYSLKASVHEVTVKRA